MTRRLILALLLLPLFARASADHWAIEGAPLRFEVEVTQPPSEPSAGILAIIPDGGLLPRPIADATVVTPAGEALPSETVWHNPAHGYAVAFLLGLAAVAHVTGSFSLSTMFPALDATDWSQAGPALLLVAAALFIVFLAENSRIPVDDPDTHLELTMIHEVMVLDHGGPDFAFILYGAALKLWVLGALLSGILLPVRTGFGVIDSAIAWAALVALAAAVGVVESSMARLRLLRVPRLLVGAVLLSGLAFVLLLR